MQEKLHRLLAQMDKCQADACLLTSNVNLFYLTGHIYNGYLYVNKNGVQYWFVKSPVGMRGEAVVPIRKVEQIPELLKERQEPFPSRVLVESGELPHQEWVRLSKLFPLAEQDASNIMRSIRSVKTEEELNLYRWSGQKHAGFYREIPSLYQDEMTDLEFSAAIEHTARLHGHLGIFRTFGLRMEAYMGSVLAGNNALVPSPYDFAIGGGGLHASLPVGPCGKKIEPGTTVMVDISGNFCGYLTDMTRTFAVGKIPADAVAIHAVSLEIQESLSKAGKPGASCGELYQMAVDIAAKHGLEACFMGMEQQAKFVGHGVGLTINELPVLCGNSKAVLQKNMVIALEPKFLIPGVGAVGTENTFIVTEEGLECITCLPEEIILL